MLETLKIVGAALLVFAAIKFGGLIGLILVLCVLGFLYTQEYK